MKQKKKSIGFYKTESKTTNPLWKWKSIEFQTTPKPPQNKLCTPVAEFFNEKPLNDVVLGPGVGAGAGCGVGLGLGVVGGAGLGGSGWNQLSTVFGIGVGCGVGIGIGYGQGYGGGFSLEAFKSYLSNRRSKSK